MSYLPKSRNRSAYYRKIIFLVIFFILGVGFFYLFENIIISTISPLWRAENTVTRIFKNSFDFFSFRGTLINENIQLKEKIYSLELERNALALNGDEKEVLLKLMGRKGESIGVMASVLTHPPQSPYDLLLIDAGFDEAIALGSRVTLPEGPEVGTVSDVSKNFSRVKLFTTSGEKTQAVLERHQVPVVLEGTGSGNFKIVVPRETEVVIGDRILSANLSASLLAVVSEIELEATDSFKTILAKSPANIFTVRFLNIKP